MSIVAAIKSVMNEYTDNKKKAMTSVPFIPTHLILQDMYICILKEYGSFHE